MFTTALIVLVLFPFWTGFAALTIACALVTAVAIFAIPFAGYLLARDIQTSWASVQQLGRKAFGILPLPGFRLVHLKSGLSEFIYKAVLPPSTLGIYDHRRIGGLVPLGPQTIRVRRHR